MSLSGICLAIFEGEDFKTVSGWRCDSVQESLSTMREVLGSIPCTKQNKTNFGLAVPSGTCEAEAGGVSGQSASHRGTLSRKTKTKSKQTNPKLN